MCGFFVVYRNYGVFIVVWDREDVKEEGEGRVLSKVWCILLGEVWIQRPRQKERRSCQNEIILGYLCYYFLFVI